MKRILFICFLFSFLSVFSQSTDNNLWQEFLPYGNVNQVVKKGDIIYAASDYSLFSLSTSDNSIERISKVNRLNDFGVAAISFNSTSQKLVIGYKNGNIDFLTSENVVGQPAIKNSSVIGDKTIYSLYSDNEKVYVSTGFSIVVLDAVSTEVIDTYVIGDAGAQLKINAVCTDDVYIYAATDSGIKRAEKANEFLANSDFWELITDIPNHTEPMNNIVSFDGKLFVTYKPNDIDPDIIYYFNGSSWNIFNELLGYKIKSTTTTESEIVFTTQNDVWIFDKMLFLVQSFNQENQINYAIKEGDIFWLGGTFNQGLVKVENGVTSSFVPKGPIDRDAYSLSEIIDGKFFKVSGGVSGSGDQPLFNFSGAASFDGLNWKSYNRFTDAIFNQSGYFDYLYVAINENNPSQVAFSTYVQGGLFELNEETVTQYTTANSTLYQDPSTLRYRLAGLSYDNEGNLWVANSFSPRQLSVKTQSGEWTSFSFGSSVSSSRFSELIVDSRGFKWIVSPGGAGVIVLDDNQTPLDNSDDKVKLLTSGGGSGDLPTSDVWSIEEDLNGSIWIGTSEGPAVFFNPSSIFDGGVDNDAKQILIEQDGNAEILLGAERIIAIEVDGANRKWFGTENSGVFVFEADSYEQIFHFTKDNSPLFSNTINDIKIDHELGIAYIATSEGLLGFKTDATQPRNDFLDAYAYPNLVRENYEGNIYINGLMLNSNCKITDIEGNLVAEVQSLGGQAVWDGRDKFSNRVKTGVYLVFLANADGSKTEVTKIMVVR